MGPQTMASDLASFKNVNKVDMPCCKPVACRERKREGGREGGRDLVHFFFEGTKDFVALG